MNYVINRTRALLTKFNSILFRARGCSRYVLTHGDFMRNLRKPITFLYRVMRTISEYTFYL